jgi:RecA/RadA recombinase
MSTLLEKMLKVGTTKTSSVLATSQFFNTKEAIPTDLPILNIAFSGSLDGGLLPGLTVVAGMSKTFKTMLSLYCMKAYLDQYKDGIALLYDSEFGITPEYIAGFDIDINRVVHIPIQNVEELKFDIVQKLEAITKKDRVFIMIDSIGNLASKKELEDAQNEKSVADMSRAKSLKSLFRIITPYLTTRGIPCLAINHVYQEIGLYPKAIVSGGTGIMYSANTVFIISKSQEKDGTELSGWKFTINIEKSRYVKEKSKLPFTVTYDDGIQKWTAIFDLAMEADFIRKPKVGWYQTVDPETGEVSDKNWRHADLLGNDEYFEALVKNDDFKKFVEGKFKLAASQRANSEYAIDPDDEDELDES